MIDFIIPSVGRPTLKNTLQSLIDQTNPGWRAFVGFDGLTEEQVDKDILIIDDRINYIFIDNKIGKFDYSSGLSRPTGNSGVVRNCIIEQISSPSEWIGFLDDDDTIRSGYTTQLIEELKNNNFDCCVFRMEHNDKVNNKIHIIPPMGMTTIAQNFVGISFCVNYSFLKKSKVLFFNSSSEDYSFLESIQRNGGRIYISDYIAYDVRPGE